jgi:hypothetical protein
MDETSEKRIRELRAIIAHEDFVTNIYSTLALASFIGGSLIAAPIISQGSGLIWFILFITFLLITAWLFTKEEDYKKKYESEHEELRRLFRMERSIYKPTAVTEQPPAAQGMASKAPLHGSWQELRERVIKRDGGRCTMCAASSRLTVDHIQELSLGGNNAMSNLRTLCATCHEDRHGRAFMDEEFQVDSNYGSNYKLNPKVAALNRSQRTNSGVGIKYVDRQKLYSERVIHPKRIWSDPKTQHVYVSAFDELDNSDRTFKLSRMKLSKGRLNFYDNETNSNPTTSDPGDDWLKRNGFSK